MFSTITGVLSVLNEFNLLSKWYVVLILGILSGPVLSYSDIDLKIHKFLYEKLKLGKNITSKTTLLKLLDSIFTGTAWWLAIQALILNPIFKLSFSNYSWLYLSTFILGFLLKFVFGRAYIYEDNFEFSSRSWRFQNFISNESFLNQLLNVWKSYSYPSLHTIILLSGVFLGIFPNELYVLSILTILWLVIANHHWFSDIISSILICYAVMLFNNQVLL